MNERRKQGIPTTFSSCGSLAEYNFHNHVVLIIPTAR